MTEFLGRQPQTCRINYLINALPRQLCVSWEALFQIRGGKGLLRERTEVNSLPGSPIDVLQEISRRPNGITVPGAGGTKTLVTLDTVFGVRMYS